MKTSTPSCKKACVLVLFFFFFVTGITYATVGGPTYIGSLKYNHADESIYFTSISESGRGCPPMLHKISLESEKTSIVISCEQGEAMFDNQGSLRSDMSALYLEIQRLTSNAKDLTSISLPKNNINVDITFVREEKMEGWVMRRHFVATVFEDNKKIDEFPLAGCSVDQPFTFAGYAIPGFEKKMILLASAKSDCFEGGYTGESLHVIGGVESIDKTQTGSWKSERTPLIPHEGTLVVYEKDTPALASPTNSPTQNPGTTTSETSKPFRINSVALFAIALVGGICTGVFLARNKRK